jgi:hypothetical protein
VRCALPVGIGFEKGFVVLECYMITETNMVIFIILLYILWNYIRRLIDMSKLYILCERHDQGLITI